MVWRFGKGVRDIIHVSPEEGTSVADAVEQLVPGGGNVVHWLIRSKREALRGVASVINAHVADLDKIDDALTDSHRPPTKLGKQLLAYPAKRAMAVHTLISQAQSAILQGLVATLSEPDPDPAAGEPGEQPEHDPYDSPAPRSKTGAQKIQIE